MHLKETPDLCKYTLIPYGNAEKKVKREVHSVYLWYMWIKSKSRFWETCRCSNGGAASVLWEFRSWGHSILATNQSFSCLPHSPGGATIGLYHEKARFTLGDLYKPFIALKILLMLKAAFQTWLNLDFENLHCVKSRWTKKMPHWVSPPHVVFSCEWQ